MDQMILDTETTGLDPNQGQRIIELGCIKLINRHLADDHYQCFFNPGRPIDAGAEQVHGITSQSLQDKPKFRERIEEIIEYIRDHELIIHNAKFDVGFLNHEFALAGRKYGKVKDYCKVFDTLALARKLHPGQKNNLDALCKRYNVDNSNRERHGALLDSQILAQVYLAMTSGQDSFAFNKKQNQTEQAETHEPLELSKPTKLITATEAEQQAHQEYLESMKTKSGACQWQEQD